MRGPKAKTKRNSRVVSFGDISQIEPTSPLGDIAKVEFRRLLTLLDSRGQLDRVDIGIVTAAARTKELVDELYSAINKIASITEISQAENLYLGRLRALGLPLQPSRTLVKTTIKEAKPGAEPIAGLVKIHA
jgi:hypothetical protein